MSLSCNKVRGAEQVLFVIIKILLRLADAEMKAGTKILNLPF